MMNTIVFFSVLVSSLIQPLTERLEDLVCITGSFTQTDYWALTLDSEVTDGTMYLAQPNLFLLSYNNANGRAMGCDGTKTFTVDPEFREILVYTGAPDGFLHILSTASNPASQRLLSEQGDSITVAADGDFDGGIRQIIVGYTLSDSLPFFFKTVDVNGNSTSWEISDIRSVDTVPDVFSVPELEGYAVVDAGTL